MDSMLTRFAYLLMMISYQNEGTLGEYMDPLKNWGTDFLDWLGKNKKDLCEKLTEIFKAEGPEPDEAIYTLPGLEFSDLLQAWADYIDSDQEKKEIIGKEIHSWFFWKSEPADFYYWLPSGGIPDLKTAVEMCKLEWPLLDWTGAPTKLTEEYDI